VPGSVGIGKLSIKLSYRPSVCNRRSDCVWSGEKPDLRPSGPGIPKQPIPGRLAVAAVEPSAPI